MLMALAIFSFRASCVLALAACSFCNLLCSDTLTPRICWASFMFLMPNWVAMACCVNLSRSLNALPVLCNPLITSSILLS